ncbi:glycosyltransferase family 2 protein [Glaciecola sp. SC05]|uniref:glycosyltransferase family 2 protein n=1 Tax=Glaciecola sp. SC05 TaxID=1987355 RepID=UPI003526F2D7
MIPSISAVIPVFNGEQFIVEAIKSVISQTHSVQEIIIIDDGSTDRSYELAFGLSKTSPIPIKIFRQKNSGVSVARNFGLLCSSCALIAFLDVDDIWASDKIKKQILLHSGAENETVFSFCDFYFNSSVEENRKFFRCPSIYNLLEYQYSKEDFQCAFINENFVGTASCIMFNRELALKINGFNAVMNHSEDFDFILRYSNHAPVKILNEVLTTKRIHGNNLTGNLRLHFWSHLYALKMNIHSQSRYCRFNYSEAVLGALRYSHDVYSMKYSNELYEKKPVEGLKSYLKGLFQAKSLKGFRIISMGLVRKLLRTLTFNRVKR